MRHAFDFYFFHSPSCRDLKKKIPGGGGGGDYYLSLSGEGGIWGMLLVILQCNGLEWLLNLGNSLTFSLLVFGLQSKFASSIFHVSYTTLECFSNHIELRKVVFSQIWEYTVCLKDKRISIDTCMYRELKEIGGVVDLFEYLRIILTFVTSHSHGLCLC